jgi:selenocysteine lyase/cysteine desulfurase
MAALTTSYAPAPTSPDAEVTGPARGGLPASVGSGGPLLPVVGAGLPVPLVTGQEVAYANLDQAASGSCLQSVADHVAQVLPYYASVHRGAGYASQVSTALLETSRRAVGQFVGARAGDVVVFTRNTTDAINLLAGCLPRWGDVVHLDIEHHANLLPWQRVPHRTLVAGATVEETLQPLGDTLRERPAALVAITGASNVTGEVLPIERLVRLAHAHGARVLVDAAQLAPHRRIDLCESGIDYVAFSGHKLYAPYGAGVLVGRRDWLDMGTPYLAGGGAVRSVSMDRVDWAAAPARHEGGTPNVVGAAALAAACRALAELAPGAVETHEEALRSRLVVGLQGIPGVELLRIWPDTAETIGVAAFTVEGYGAAQVAAYLSAEHGIGVRDGAFCAHPLLARLGRPEGAVRASVGVGTTTADVDRLVGAVRELVERGPQWTYAEVDGRIAPSPDPRPLPAWADPSGLASVAGASPCQE